MCWPKLSRGKTIKEIEIRQYSFSYWFCNILDRFSLCLEVWMFTFSKGPYQSTITLTAPKEDFTQTPCWAWSKHVSIFHPVYSICWKHRDPNHTHLNNYFPIAPLIKQKKKKMYLLVWPKTNWLLKKINKKIRVGNSIVIKCLNVKIAL